MKKYKDLTEREQDLFCETFYESWERDKDLQDYEKDTKENPNPWGCPWYFRENEELLSDDIEKASNLWFEANKEEILEISKLEYLEERSALAWENQEDLD